MLERFINTKNKMSKKITIDNLANNLNDDSESKMKSKNCTFSDILDDIKKDAHDSGNDSDNSCEEISTSYENIDSLIEAMTSCEINKKANNDIKGNLDKNKSSDKSVSNIKNINHESTTKRIIDLVKNDFDSVNNVDDSKQVKCPSTKKIHFKLKKSSKSRNKEKDNQSDSCVSKITVSTDQTNKNVNQICEKLSTVTISKEKQGTSQSDIKTSKGKKKSEDSNVVNEKKPVSSNSKGKDVIFMERGPIIGSSLNFMRKEIHPYENKQVHSKALSGGKLLMNKLPNLNDDAVKITIQNKIEFNIDPPQVNNRIINASSTLNEDLNYLCEIIEGNEVNKLTYENSEHKITEVENIMKYLTESSSSFSENSIANSPEFGNSNSFIAMSPNPNQNLNYLTNNDIPTYTHQYSPDQGIGSPSLENTDNAQFYESPYESILSISKESNESYSSNNSPNFQVTDETCFQLDDLVQTADPNVCSSFLNNNIYSLSPEAQNVNSNSNSYAYSHIENLNMTQTLNNSLGNSNAIVANGISNFYGDVFLPIIEKSPQYQSSFTNHDTRFNNQPISDVSLNTLKTSKRKLIPIASKEGLQCCLDNKKSASEIMVQMFKRLDDNMQKRICSEVHKISEDKLMESFDGQLSSWNNVGSQFPRFPLLYVTCERLFMQTKTMEKFFEIYHNGHTVLDRAVLTCWQTPLVGKYLAECMIKVKGHKNLDLSLDESDRPCSTVLHRAVKQGENCAMALASLLSLNEQYGQSIFNVNKFDKNGCTPLHIACSTHRRPTPEFTCPCQLTTHVLLKHGKADPNQKDRCSGNTALHIAVGASVCAPKLVMLLLQHGAQPSIKNYKGDTALDMAKALNRSTSRDPHIKQVVDMLKKLK